MAHPTRIVSATDLSPAARHAAERAALISLVTAAPLCLLHVVDLTPLERLRKFMAGVPGEFEAGMLDAARRQLAELATSLQGRYGVRAVAQVATGALPAALAKQAAALAAGLLVCGARGEGGLRYLALGSSVSRLLDTATCPVLVVKQAPHERYRRVLLPVDFSPSSPGAIRDARQFAPGADMVLLHAFDVPFEGYMRYAGVTQDTIEHYLQMAGEDVRARLRALRDAAGLGPGDAELIVLHGNPIVSIIEQEQAAGCDLTVMGKHGQGLLEKLLLGSVTKQVLAGSRGDVLVSGAPRAPHPAGHRAARR